MEILEPVALETETSEVDPETLKTETLEAEILIQWIGIGILHAGG